MSDIFLARRVRHGAITYKYRIFVPISFRSGQHLPLVVFLHGTGEWGSNNKAQTRAGLGETVKESRATFPAFVLFPQAPKPEVWGGSMAEVVMGQLKQTIEEFSCDSTRVYVTGLSLGGDGSWELAAMYPQHFAATVPVAGEVMLEPGSPLCALVPAGTADPYAAIAARLRRMPTWIFHGENDTVAPVQSARRMEQALREAGGIVRLTVYPNEEHDVWDRAYSDERLWTWLFSIARID